jgi:hypothetical protein
VSVAAGFKSGDSEAAVLTEGRLELPGRSVRIVAQPQVGLQLRRCRAALTYSRECRLPTRWGPWNRPVVDWTDWPAIGAPMERNHFTGVWRCEVFATGIRVLVIGAHGDVGNQISDRRSGYRARI